MSATKLFISHASDDKKDFVEPLVAALEIAGFAVWYDKYELNIGDSLRQKIDQGLKDCDFGVVVFSSHFFAKKWPQTELDGLLALEEINQKLILPIWKDVGEKEVKKFSPTLAGRLGAPSTGGVDEVVIAIRRSVEAAQRDAELRGPKSHRDRLTTLEENTLEHRRAQALIQSHDGVRIAHEAAEALMVSIMPEVEALASSRSLFKLTTKGPEGNALSVKGPYRLNVAISYFNTYTNTAEQASLRLIATQATGDWGGDPSAFRILYNLELQPQITPSGSVLWKGRDTVCVYENSQLVEHFLKVVVDHIEELHLKNTEGK